MTAPDAEAMQWGEMAEPAVTSAQQIVTWVNANGGEAQYEPASNVHGTLRGGPWPARILIRQRDGSEAACSPGQWVVKGAMLTICEHGYSPATCRNYRQVREFTVESR